MRSLTVAVVVESVLLVVLVVMWAMRGDEGAAPGAQPAFAGTTDAAAAAARTADLSGGEATARRAGDDLRRSIEAIATGTSGSIVLRGKVVVPVGDAIPEDLSITLRREGEWQGALVGNGQYAVAGLSPGTWEIDLRAKDFVTKREELTLDASAVQAHDLVLERAQTVAVYLRTPDGRPLLDPKGIAAHADSFTIAAFERPLDGDLPPTSSRRVFGVGCARWSPSSEREGAPAAGSPDGTLILDRAPPLHAALLFRHLVLAQQPLQAGQDSLTFTVDPDSIAARCGTVRARLLDAATGQPITDDAILEVSSAQGGGGGTGRPDANGEVVVANLPPGLARLEVRAGKREFLLFMGLVPVAATLDLGDLAVHGVIEWKGRLLDDAGMGVSGFVRWTELTSPRARGTSIDWRATMADGDGEYTIQSGPGRMLVDAVVDDGRRGHAIVEVRAGVNPAFELRVAPVTRVRVIATGDPLRGYALELFDERGEIVAARRIEARWRETVFAVPPGRYQLEVWDDADALLEKRAIEVGAQALRVEVPR